MRVGHDYIPKHTKRTSIYICLYINIFLMPSTLDFVLFLLMFQMKNSHRTGTVLDLSEDTVLGILSACRQEIGTMFGYTAENRGVGITGGVDYVDMDGPTIILRLKGRFWHERKTVLARVGSYLKGRIPEIVDVVIEDEWQLTDEANEQW